MAAADPTAEAAGAVLLVEPDAGLRWALEQILVETGCRVLCASDGREAIRRASESPGPLGLVLAELRGAGIDPGGWPLLVKPVRMHDLTRLVRALFAGDGRDGALPTLRSPPPGRRSRC
jgi:DNA-binding NtrC family response regulator